jgi:hypothetical protein
MALAAVVTDTDSLWRAGYKKRPDEKTSEGVAAVVL